MASFCLDGWMQMNSGYNNLNYEVVWLLHLPQILILYQLALYIPQLIIYMVILLQFDKPEFNFWSYSSAIKK
jgi:hypothetical protein